MADGKGADVEDKGVAPSSDREGRAQAADASVDAESRVSFTLIEPIARALPRAVRVETPRSRRTALGLVLGAAVAELVGGVAFGGLGVALVTLALALAAVAAVVVARRGARARAQAPKEEAPEPEPSPAGERRALVLTPGALALERRTGGQTSLPGVLELGQGFGVVLVSNRRRDRLVAAVTSDAGTMLFATTLDDADRRRLARFVARSTVVGGDEQALDATGFDGSPVHLDPTAFSALLASLMGRDAGCLDRIVLSDQHGRALRLDQHALTAQGKRFDLTRPLEWRPILFQEPFGQAVTLYQGTWIRQGATEVVLVSLLTPSFFEASATDAEGTGVHELDVMARRDQRLLHATAADPPPSEQRVAMDGLFVVPMRAALEQAPRASSQTVRSGHP